MMCLHDFFNFRVILLVKLNIFGKLFAWSVFLGKIVVALSLKAENTNLHCSLNSQVWLEQILELSLVFWASKQRLFVVNKRTTLHIFLRAYTFFLWTSFNIRGGGSDLKFRCISNPNYLHYGRKIQLSKPVLKGLM